MFALLVIELEQQTEKKLYFSLAYEIIEFFVVFATLVVLPLLLPLLLLLY
jgi:hypothetical protein